MRGELDASGADFWRRFAAEHWERRAMAYQGPPLAPALHQQRLFDALVDCARAHLATRSSPWMWLAHFARLALARLVNLPSPRGYFRAPPRIFFRFYVERRRPPSVRLLRRLFGLGMARRWCLPAATDGSFTGYHERIKRRLNRRWRRLLGLRERRYYLAVNFQELLDFSLWSWEREFLARLYEQAGMNNAGAYNAVFLGDIDKTPFGVHIDPESVFHIPVVGRKAMRVWPADYADRNPALKGAQSYAEHVAASTFVEAGVGGFVYWPSSMWHVAEGDGSLSVSIALSLCVEPDRSAVARVGAGAAGGAKTVPFAPRDLQAAVQAVPSGLKLDMPMAAQRGQSLAAAWVSLATGMGFSHPPRALGGAELGEADTVCSTSRWPIVHVRTADGQLLIGANGHVFACDDRGEILSLVERLNAGRPARVGALLEACASQAGAAVAMGVLRELQRARAIERQARSD
jgi:hypothetical protein